MGLLVFPDTRKYLLVGVKTACFVFVVIIIYVMVWCERKLRRFDYFIVCEEDPVGLVIISAFVQVSAVVTTLIIND